MAVVDEDRGQLRVHVQCRGHAADVPAVARRDERQQTNGGVLRRVQRAGDGGGVDTQLREHQRIDGVGHCARAQGLLRHVERDVVAHRAIGETHLIAGHGIGDLDLEVGDPQARRVIHETIGLRENPDIRRRARLRRVIRDLRMHERHVIAEVEFVDHVGLSQVQVDRAGMDLAGGAGGVNGAEQPAGGVVDDHDFLA